LFQFTLEKTNFNLFIFRQFVLENYMLDGRASPSLPAFLACMLQMPITLFPLVPTPQSTIKAELKRKAEKVEQAHKLAKKEKKDKKKKKAPRKKTQKQRIKAEAEQKRLKKKAKRARKLAKRKRKKKKNKITAQKKAAQKREIKKVKRKKMRLRRKAEIQRRYAAVFYSNALFIATMVKLLCFGCRVLLNRYRLLALYLIRFLAPLSASMVTSLRTDYLCPFAESAAVHVQNLLPTKVNPGNMSPHQRLAQWLKIHREYEEPYIAYLRTWGCKAWVWQKVPKFQRTKARAIKGFWWITTIYMAQFTLCTFPAPKKCSDVQTCVLIIASNIPSHSMSPLRPWQSLTTLRKRSVLSSLQFLKALQSSGRMNICPRISLKHQLLLILQLYLPANPTLPFRLLLPLLKKKKNFYNAEEHSEFLIDSPTGEKQNLLDSEGPIAANQPSEQLIPFKS
jgi:hypothetical protein